jgi:hypothetical protein
MRSRSLQKAVLNVGSRVFARDDKEGTRTQATHTLSGRINIVLIGPLVPNTSVHSSLISE